jgi:hypothetical protein
LARVEEQKGLPTLIEATLHALAEADMLREETAPTAGRTATVWRVNPMLWRAS